MKTKKILILEAIKGIQGIETKKQFQIKLYLKSWKSIHTTEFSPKRSKKYPTIKDRVISEARRIMLNRKKEIWETKDERFNYDLSLKNIEKLEIKALK